jgi:nitrogen-specific signal transduction histidine kinase
VPRKEEKLPSQAQEQLVHQLRNQLTVAGGTAQLLARMAAQGPVSTSVLAERLARVVSVLDRMRDTLDELEARTVLEDEAA